MQHFFYVSIDVKLKIWLLSTIVLDDNQKLWINEVPEVLIGVGTLTSTSSFETQTLAFCYNEWVKNAMPGGM